MRIALVILTLVQLFVCLLVREWNWIGASWVIAMSLYGLILKPARGIVGLLYLPLVFIVTSGLAGVVTYFAGTARYLSYGYPPAWPNPDPITRVRPRSTGCMVSGLERFTHSPNNAVIDVLGAVLGPMPGAYSGPLPDEAAGLALVQNAGASVTRAEVFDGRLGGGSAVAMNEDLQGFLTSTFRGSDSDLLVVPLQQGGVLIYGSRGPDKALALIDAEGARPVARWFQQPR